MFTLSSIPRALIALCAAASVVETEAGETIGGIASAKVAKLAALSKMPDSQIASLRRRADTFVQPLKEYIEVKGKCQVGISQHIGNEAADLRKARKILDGIVSLRKVMPLEAESVAA